MALWIGIDADGTAVLWRRKPKWLADAGEWDCSDPYDAIVETNDGELARDFGIRNPKRAALYLLDVQPKLRDWKRAKR